MSGRPSPSRSPTVNPSLRRPGFCETTSWRVNAIVSERTTDTCTTARRNAIAERSGTRPLRVLAEPAIRLAREGVTRSPGLARMTEWSRTLLADDRAAAAIFLAGDPLVQRDLAVTLAELDGFYAGPV